MPNLRLTKDAIRRLPAPDPSGKQMLYWDADLKGFGVLVSGTTTAKSFVVQREVKGLTRRVKLLTWAEFEASRRTIEDVRAEAVELLTNMRKGIDPKARRAPTADTTLRRMLDTYLLEHPLAANSKIIYRYAVERWLDDWLDRPLREITPEMVRLRFRSIKSAVARRPRAQFTSEPGAATANGVMRALRLVWNYAAEAIPDLPPNPVRLKKQWHTLPERERHVSGDQLPRFYKAVTELPNITMRDYLLLVLFTGLRRSEAASLRWADIDFASRIIRLPAQRTKAKRKLDLPMSDFVHGLLVARRAMGYENAYVFPSDSRTGHIHDPQNALVQVSAAVGTYVSTHDLRRTFVTVASQCRIPPMALSGLVNHSPGKSITAGYSQISTADLADAMQVITDRLKVLCQVPVLGDGVVPLRA